MRTLGIDPGIYGGVALVDGRDLLGLWRTPVTRWSVNGAARERIDGKTLALLLAAHRTPYTIVETVGGISGQSASAAFVFGEATGLVLGILAGLGVEPMRCTADKWSRGVGIPPGGGKASRIAQASRLFPAHAHRFLETDGDGLADAALIALYAQRLF